MQRSRGVLPLAVVSMYVHVPHATYLCQHAQPSPDRPDLSCPRVETHQLDLAIEMSDASSHASSQARPCSYQTRMAAAPVQGHLSPTPARTAGTAPAAPLLIPQALAAAGATRSRVRHVHHRHARHRQRSKVEATVTFRWDEQPTDSFKMHLDVRTHCGFSGASLQSQTCP